MRQKNSFEDTIQYAACRQTVPRYIIKKIALKVSSATNVSEESNKQKLKICLI
jgi:hypothetical protein